MPATATVLSPFYINTVDLALLVSAVGQTVTWNMKDWSLTGTLTSCSIIDGHLSICVTSRTDRDFSTGRVLEGDTVEVLA